MMRVVILFNMVSLGGLEINIGTVIELERIPFKAEFFRFFITFLSAILLIKFLHPLASNYVAHR